MFFVHLPKAAQPLKERHTYQHDPSNDLVVKNQADCSAYHQSQDYGNAQEVAQREELFRWIEGLVAHMFFRVEGLGVI